MLEERNFRPLIYLRWQPPPRNNVSKATSEWRVVTSVQPSPLVWFMGPGSNKNGNQINPATLQVEGCLIELSKAWLRLRMIMPGNGEGSISPHPTRTPYISPCSIPTPVCNVSKITAHLPLACLLSLKVICRLKDSPCQRMMNAMYTDKSSVRSKISRKTHWSVNNLKKRSWRLAMMLLGMIHQTQLPQSLKWIISLDSLTQVKCVWLPSYPQVTGIILGMFIKSVLSIFLLIIFYLSCPWGMSQAHIDVKGCNIRRMASPLNLHGSARRIELQPFATGFKLIPEICSKPRGPVSEVDGRLLTELLYKAERKKEQTIIMWGICSGFELMTTPASLFTVPEEAHVEEVNWIKVQAAA